MQELKFYRFRIQLNDYYPVVWREIEVPADYTFWDLHVAIQDAMGWTDSHLHEFQPTKKGPTAGLPIGIPADMDFDDMPETVPSWSVTLKKYFTTLGNRIDYLYDFGDCWQHQIRLTGMFLSFTEQCLPRCVDGEGLCPPEDCGGPHGYMALCLAVADKNHEEHQDYRQWLKAMGKPYWPFDPGFFDVKQVDFSDPFERWNRCFADDLS